MTNGRFELISGVDGGVIVWDKVMEEVIDAMTADEARAYFSREVVEADQTNPSPAKPLSFHPAHTCSECGHVTVPAIDYEALYAEVTQRFPNVISALQSPPTKDEDR